MVSGVIKRGVYVVEKHDHRYLIKNYFNNAVLLPMVPTKSMAIDFCERFNSGLKLSADRMKQLTHILGRIDKLNDDCVFYRHTLSVSNDSFKIAVVESRLDLALAQIKELIAELKIG